LIQSCRWLLVAIGHLSEVRSVLRVLAVVVLGELARHPLLAPDLLSRSPWVLAEVFVPLSEVPIDGFTSRIR
jgi:hypothetical protein